MIDNAKNPLNIIQGGLGVLGNHYFRMNILTSKSLICVLCGSVMVSVKHRVVGNGS